MRSRTFRRGRVRAVVCRTWTAQLTALSRRRVPPTVEAVYLGSTPREIEQDEEHKSDHRPRLNISAPLALRHPDVV
jgi:hypothetical protein